MADRTPTNERLGHLGHGDGTLNPRGHAEFLERILQGESVDDGGEHAHVITCGAVDAPFAPLQTAEDVTTSDDDHDFDVQLAHPLDLPGDIMHCLGTDARTG